MINIKMQPASVNKLTPKIAVIGVGGAGGNAVNNMISSNLEGCEFLVCNTDAQALQGSLAPNKIQLGVNITGGLGAGSRPEVGLAAAEESLDEVMGYLDGANMAFVTAGMGGGTGTGAAPIIAKACRQQGILTVGVVTKPFHFEGAHRMEQAEAGIRELQQYVDTLIVIPNQNLFRIANEKTTFAESFKLADSVLQSGVRGVTDLMVRPGLVNLDFADIRTAMQQMGKAMMGTGEASGDKRAIEAAEAAINNPLLDDVSMKGAQGVIINVTGGYDMTLFEADEACNRIRDEVDPKANIIFGATFDQNLDGFMRVSIIATGIDRESVKSRIATGGTGTSGGGGGGSKILEEKPQQTQSFISSVSSASAAPLVPQRDVAAVGAGYLARAAAPDSVRTEQPKAAVNPFSAREAIRGLTAPPSIDAARDADKSDDEGKEEGSTSGESFVEMYEQGEFVIAGLGNPVMPQNTALRGTTYKNSFIPPKPIEPDMEIPEDRIGDHIGNFHGAHADKAATARNSSGLFPNMPEQAQQQEASLRLNPPRVASPLQPPKRSLSLFERITGSMQQHIDNFRDDSDMLQNKPVRASTPAAAAPQNYHGGGGKVAMNAAPAQASLNISAPAAKPAAKIDDELDIPAFLRRQAN